MFVSRVPWHVLVAWCMSVFAEIPMVMEPLHELAGGVLFIGAGPIIQSLKWKSSSLCCCLAPLLLVQFLVFGHL